MDLEQEIRRVLEEDVRLYIQSHGGDVTLRSLDGDNTAVIALTGACAGCPSADLGTRAMIAEVLARKVPAIRGVELERSASPELMELITKALRHEIELG